MDILQHNTSTPVAFFEQIAFVMHTMQTLKVGDESDFEYLKHRLISEGRRIARHRGNGAPTQREAK